MKAKVLLDQGYQEAMRNMVEPYLQLHACEGWLERDGGRLHYVSYADTGEPRGVVLISHGFTESAEKFKEMAWYFLQEGFCVYIPDHCGHGGSYRLSHDISLVHVDRWQRFIEDLSCVASLARREHPGLGLYLYGHSMGGGIAAAAAAIDPQLFERVILSSPMICPATGKVPAALACAIAQASCLLGREGSYVAGQSPYQGKGDFAGSAGTSQARFDYYEDKRAADSRWQTNAASYGWLREAMRLSRYLQKTAWKQIRVPVLIFQAEDEVWVSNRQMNQFVHKLRRSGQASVTAVRMPGSRHEIYNGDARLLARYLRRIFAFLE